VQRIQNAKITAKADGRAADGTPGTLKDGDVVTACQQTCPADAIAFGNINDPESRVAKLKKQERNYGLLEELRVVPRTTYLGRLRNVNPELEKEA
jgi:molybdopterin-containing oxidoreductase family iron-sulfur binding subunit